MSGFSGGPAGGADVLRQEGTQVLAAGMLQGGDPVGMAGDGVFQTVAHVPAVAEVIVPLVVNLLKKCLAAASDSGVRTYWLFSQ